MDEQQASFAGLLRDLRAEARLTQEELAEASGVRPRSISDLERGVAKSPQKDTVKRLADALNLIGLVRTEFEAIARGRPVPTGTGIAGRGGAAAATRTLPRDITSFTGRDQDLQDVVQAAADAAQSGGIVGICAIGGMAGVGKTAFALHAAHQLAPQFPAGQIFLPLYGHTPGRQPIDPAEALASLLLTVGVPASRIPPGLEARMALWRDQLAERRLLLVLDDARNSDQVKPLLPGTGGSLVLVTSRRRLSALDDVTTISLGVLSPSEAGTLLVRLVGRPGLSPTDPAVKKITELCGHLPLALGMVARQLHQHPAWSVTGRVAELAAARNRLELMATENLSVAAAFNLSYQDLPDDQQRLFRQLGLLPGNDFDAYAVAALSGGDLETARGLLEALYDQYLLIEIAHGRYQLHDLIRQHARTLVRTRDPLSDREEATARLVDYFQYAAGLADVRLARQSRAGLSPGAPAPTVAVADLPDSAQALVWARTERPNLLACLDHVTRLGHDARVVTLTASLAGLFRHDGPWAEAADRHNVAIAAARRLGDRAGVAGGLIDLGVIKWLTDDPTAAAEALQQALDVYRELGDRLGEANALNDLGHVRQLNDDHPAAAQAQLEALSIYTELGDRLGQANALTSLGIVRRQTGDFREAVDALTRGLDIYRGIGDRLGQANALSSLGIVRWQSDDYPGAATALQDALAICRELGDRVGQANALINLGAVWRQTGDYQASAEALEECFTTYRDIGSRLGQANALAYLGTLRRQMKDYLGAAVALKESLGMLRDIGDRDGRAAALLYLGAVQRQSGEHAAAAAALAEALDIFRDIGDRGGEVEAINELGKLDLDRGELAEAEAHHHAALDLARLIGSPWDEAHALAGLARCALAVGRTADAVSGLRQAHEIFDRMGAAEADDLAAELDTLTNPGPGG